MGEYHKTPKSSIEKRKFEQQENNFRATTAFFWMSAGPRFLYISASVNKYREGTS